MPAHYLHSRHRQPRSTIPHRHAQECQMEVKSFQIHHTVGQAIREKSRMNDVK